ncbi:hypothetical protein XA68_14350 [Ophiocordyceps unilateralis]|uniref:Complex 1 LYR protein domain-containing protein n=1 Tax=Ophiocordyceps unilateralis TaxID=268505 RepID=A0A2A9PAJ6_OPHUN|nr:hypothetical protein XA68_14350 [Ophiocordyceps unilateralis]
MRLSGLQKDVLCLYRQCLRASRRKPEDTRSHFESFVRAEFTRHMSIDKRDFDTIEFLLRKGRRQLQVYAAPDIKDLFQFLAPQLAAVCFPRRRSPPVSPPKHDASGPLMISQFKSTLSCHYSVTNIKMATLASIPEASTLLPNTHDSRPLQRTASFERIRPRSRVLILSRRPTRVRNPARRAPVAAAPRQASGQRHPPAEVSCRASSHLEASDVTPGDAPKAPQRSHSRPPYHRFDSASPTDQALETSVSSVDLDSFPLPPSHRGLAKRSSPNPQAGPNRDGAISPTRDGPFSSARRCFGEVAADVARASKHSSIDSTLVEAISRTIAQQFRLLSVAKYADRELIHPSRSSFSPSFAHASRPEKPRRRDSLDRFTADLYKYAYNTGPRDEAEQSSPDPPRSGESLHTVSALMPFRPEFRAAGLAVTSKDQAERSPGYLSRAYASLRSRQLLSKAPRNRNLHASQIDGPGEVPSSSTNTEISFAPSQADEWRSALIEEVPVRKKKRGKKAKRQRKSCFPCFRGKEKPAADGDWAHFREAPEKPAADRHAAWESRPTRPRLPPILQTAETRPSRFDSVPRSPKHVSIPQPMIKRKDINALPKSVARPRGQATKDKQPTTLPTNLAPFKTQSGAFPRRDGDKRRKPGSRREPVILSSKTDRQASGRETGRVPSKAKAGDMPEEDHGHALSALPSTWFRQDGPIPDLEEELEKTARLVANTKPSATSRRPTTSTRRQKQPTLRYDPNHMGICCRSSRGLPSRATAPPNIPMRTSSVKGSVSSDADDEGIKDGDVLRGLHVAASAACDQEVDAFVRDQTGLRIRRFLADLMTLEAFGHPLPGEGSEQRAWRRRAEMRPLKRRVRRSRELSGVAGGFI